MKTDGGLTGYIDHFSSVAATDISTSGTTMGDSCGCGRLADLKSLQGGFPSAVYGRAIRTQRRNFAFEPASCSKRDLYVAELQTRTKKS